VQTVELVGRLLISLAVVIGLIWLVAKKMRGGRRGGLRSDRLIDVLGRQNLSRTSSVAVLRVADRALIVGVTDSSVRMLGELELDAVQATLAEMDPSTRRSGIPRQRTAHDAVRDPRDILDAPTYLSDTYLDDGRLPGTASDIPSSPAELAGTLTAADIEAIHARRAGAANGVIPGRSPKTRPARDTGGLAGSALSPATWRQTLDALRDLTARKG